MCSSAFSVPSVDPGILGLTIAAFTLGLLLGSPHVSDSPSEPTSPLKLQYFIQPEWFCVLGCLMMNPQWRNGSIGSKWHSLFNRDAEEPQRFSQSVKVGDYFKALPSLNDALVQMYVRSAICSMITQEVYTCHHNCVQNSNHHRRQWERILTEGQAFQTRATWFRLWNSLDSH